MFRGFMLALTPFVFCVGLGIGISWSRGLIPLTFVAAKSGSLSVEPSGRETLPPPNDPPLSSNRQNSERERDSAQDDPEIFEKQSEPEIDKATVVMTNASSSDNQARRDAAILQEEISPPGGAQSSEWMNDRPSRSFRLRGDRIAARTESTAGKEDPMTPPPGRAVRVAAHQEPDSSDGRETPRETNTSSLSPREQLIAAEEKLAAGDTLAAHREFSKLYWNHKELRPMMQETIDDTAKAIFFQAKPNYIEPYVVQEGDRLDAIAKKYQLSWEYLARLNRTEPRRIQIGQKLKVMKGPFGAVVDLKDFALTVHLQGNYVKRYDVGIGKDGSSPVGKFPVLNKVENPAYTAPNGKVIAKDDPANPLGERWIDLGESYGIHGTIDPNSIGKAESRGCVRLRDTDIVEVYDFLVKGSEVVLRK